MREALQRLQAAGYVTARRGRGGGTFVQTGQGADSDEMIRRTLLPAWEELTEADWAALQAKFAPYETWLGSKAVSAVEKLMRLPLKPLVEMLARLLAVVSRKNDCAFMPVALV